MRKILLWSELKSQRVSREVIFSRTDFSEYHLTISYTDSKLYLAVKIQSTEHNSSAIISAEYFTSVDMIVRMITVNSISAVYSIIYRNKQIKWKVLWEMIQRGALSSLEMMFLSFSDTVTLQKKKRKKLVFSQEESKQWLVQILCHRTAETRWSWDQEKKLQRRRLHSPYYVIINSNIQSTLQICPDVIKFSLYHHLALVYVR